MMLMMCGAETMAHGNLSHGVGGAAEETLKPLKPLQQTTSHPMYGQLSCMEE